MLDKSDIAFLSLPSSKAVEPIIVSYVEKGLSGKTIIDISTSHPMSTKKLFKQVKAAGGHLVDLPLSGGPVDADSAELRGMFGGESEMFERLRPVVSYFANRYANMGDSGSDHVTKPIFSFIALSYVCIYAMTFPLTEKMGLDNHQLFDLLMTTGIACGTMNFYVPKMINKTYDMAFALGLANKDLTYVKSLFEEYQVPAYGLNGKLAMLRTAFRNGKAKEDYSACIATMFEFFEVKNQKGRDFSCLNALI